MADTKTSDLTALTGATVAQTTDVIPIVDTDATTLKKILVSELAKAIEVLATEQASTSGTSIDFTSIPAWAKRVTVQFVGVSTNGTSVPIVQIGDSGGLETSGYLGAAPQISTSSGTTNFTTGFGLLNTWISSVIFHGTMVLTLEDATNNTWVAALSGSSSASAIAASGGGSKSLSAALDRVSITTVNGIDEFDAGAINILYE